MSGTLPEDEPAEQDRSQILEWFTHARKIPELIGKLPSGEQIWGGPYRPVQLILGALVLAGGHLSMPWWSSVGGDGLFGIGFRYVIVAAAAGLTIWAARQIPLTMVNPVLVAQGGARQLVNRRAVRWAGQPVQYPASHRVHPPRVVTQSAPPTSSPPTPPTTGPRGGTAAPASAGSPESKMADLARRTHA